MGIRRFGRGMYCHGCDENHDCHDVEMIAMIPTLPLWIPTFVGITGVSNVIPGLSYVIPSGARNLR